MLTKLSMSETEGPITRAEAFFRRGRISWVQGDVKRAQHWARRALQEDPVFAPAQQMLEQLTGE